MNEQQQAIHDEMNALLRRGRGDVSVVRPDNQAYMQMGDWMRQTVNSGTQKELVPVAAPAGNEVAK